MVSAFRAEIILIWSSSTIKCTTNKIFKSKSAPIATPLDSSCSSVLPGTIKGSKNIWQALLKSIPSCFRTFALSFSEFYLNLIPRNLYSISIRYFNETYVHIQYIKLSIKPRGLFGFLHHCIPDQGIFSGFIVLHNRWWVVSTQAHAGKIKFNISR